MKRLVPFLLIALAGAVGTLTALTDAIGAGKNAAVCCISSGSNGGQGDMDDAVFYSGVEVSHLATCAESGLLAAEHSPQVLRNSHALGLARAA